MLSDKLKGLFPGYKKEYLLLSILNQAIGGIISGYLINLDNSKYFLSVELSKIIGLLLYIFFNKKKVT